MKKVFDRVLEIVKACLNAVMGAFCFIRIEHDVAYYPNDGGGVRQVDYYYSIYDKLAGKNQQFLVYIALAVMAASVALSVVSCIATDSRTIRIASHMVFGVSALYFFALLFYATQVLLIGY